MIPQIITIRDENLIDEMISHFATQHGIQTSHRIVVRPEKEELTVEQIHLLQKEIQVMFSKQVLVVLLGLDYSSSEVQNALLKSLEEDSERILFLFLVKNPTRLLSTVVSRCTINNVPHPNRNTTISEKYSDLFSFQKNSDISKEDAIKRIDGYIQSSSIKNHKILHHILSMRKLILDNNMNPILALDNILIFLSKTSTMKAIHEK
ncbi:MAG: hypothetical protein V1922_03440 [bacterium]